MTFKHKLSRRLALLKAVALAVTGGFVGCDDGPMGAPVVEEAPTFALTSSSTSVGDRVVAAKYVEVRSTSSRSSALLGVQPDGATGTLTNGPVADRGDRKQRWQVNFDQGVDGWVLATSLNKTGGAATPPAAVASVTLTPAVANISQGGNAQLSAVARDAAGNIMSGAPIAWSSANTSVATVSATGVTSGTTIGGASVIASSGGRADTTQVWVNAPSVSSVTLTPDVGNVVVGNDIQLTAVARDAGGNTLPSATFAWSTLNANIATVSTSGLVHGASIGGARIIASSSGRVDTTQIWVNPPPVGTAASLTLTPDVTNIVPNATVQLTATVGDGSGNVLAGAPVGWSTTNAGIATVSTSGLVRGIAVGGARVIASSNGRVDTTQVWVNPGSTPSPAVATVTLTPTTGTVGTGVTLQFTTVARDASGNTIAAAAINWTTSNAAVATVSSTGLARGGVAGSASIIASSGARADTSVLTVTNTPPVPPAPVATVTVSPAIASLAVGATVQFSATLRDAAGNVLTGRSITWTSSNTGSATVSSGGLVSGVAAGLATMTATSEGRAGSSAVTVTAPPPPPPGGGGALLFASDWSTGLGVSDAAVMDHNKPRPWNIHGGQGLEVISSAGLDFPTANVMRMTALTSSSGFGTVRRSGLPIPAISQNRYYRWYIRAGANIQDGNTHPIQDGYNAGASNWQFEMLHTTGGTGRWTVQFKMGANGNAYNQNFRGPALDVDVTYRFEVHLQRTSSTRYNFHVRVYNSANQLIASDTDFNNVDAYNGIADLAAQGSGQFVFTNLNSLEGLNAGCNGVAPLSSNRVYSWQAAFAVGETGWIGPYQQGEGR